MLARAVAAAAALVSAWVIAVKIGVEESGSYYIAISVATIAAVAGRRGLDIVALRMISEAHASSDVNAAAAVFRFGHRSVLTTSADPSGRNTAVGSVV